MLITGVTRSVHNCTGFSSFRGNLSCRRRLAAPATAAAATASRPLLTFQVGDTTLAVPLSIERARELQATVDNVLKTFQQKQLAERPQRWPLMEYVCKGAGAEGGEVDLLEVFCNPNAHTNAMEARVLLTVACGGLRVMTEGQLTALKGDVDTFMQLHT